MNITPDNLKSILKVCRGIRGNIQKSISIEVFISRKITYKYNKSLLCVGVRRGSIRVIIPAGEKFPSCCNHQLKVGKLKILRDPIFNPECVPGEAQFSRRTNKNEIRDALKINFFPGSD